MRGPRGLSTNMLFTPPPNRNAPCPCKSGKRFKQCCGAIGASRTGTRPDASAQPVKALLDQAARNHQAGLLDRAKELYDDALRVEPGNAIATHYLGVLAMQRGDAARGAELMKQALALRSDIPDFHTNLGLCYKRLDQVRLAIDCHRKAIALDPRNPVAHNNLAIALQEDGRVAEALDAFGRALEIDPQNAQAHYNRGLAYLVTGDYARGWEEHEWRARCKEFAGRELELPDLAPWRGEPLAGKTLLVRSEQGHGDLIQFLRFLPPLADRAASVFLEVSEELADLARSIDPRVRVIKPRSPHAGIDFYVNLMSVARWLGVTLKAIPNAPPYLKPDPERVAIWRTRLEKYPGRKIGLVWGGNPQHFNDRNRSCPLNSLLPLLGLERCSWFSLQVGPPAEQLSTPGAKPIHDLREYLKSYSDTAAALSVLDLVISVDTSVAHLAGALARPAWVLICHASEWRWLLERPDSPWYPSLRLFRQKTAGDWSPVVDEVKAALRAGAPP